MTKRILWILALSMALLFCGCGKAGKEQTVPSTVETEPVTMATTEATQPPATVPTEPPEEHFTLTFVGDCTLGSAPMHYEMATGFIKTVGEDYA